MADKFDLYFTVSSDALQAEEKVKDRLASGAEKYVAVIGLIFGFHAVELKQLSFSGSVTCSAFSVAVIAGLVLLSAALAMVLWGTRVREYPTFPVTESLHSLPNAATNDDAKKLAANTYLAVRDGIWKINEQRASNLRITGMLLLAGFLMSVIGQLGLGLKFQ